MVGEGGFEGHVMDGGEEKAKEAAGSGIGSAQVKEKSGAF